MGHFLLSSLVENAPYILSSVLNRGIAILLKGICTIANFAKMPKKISVKSKEIKENKTFDHIPKSPCQCCINQWRIKTSSSIYRDLRAVAVYINGEPRASL